MEIIAVAIHKGGTGKSTTASNIAAMAAQRGKKTLLIDLDPQGSSSYLSGVDADLDHSAGAMFRDEPVRPSELVVTTAFGFDAVPAGPSLMSAEKWIGQASMGDARLHILLNRDKALREKYDFVVLDTAGFIGGLLMSSLFCCSRVLIPIMPSRLSTKELGVMFDQVKLANNLREGIGADLISSGGIFFNRIRESTNAAKENVADVSEYMGTINQEIVKYNVAKTFIPESTAVEEAALAGAPVVNSRPKAVVSLRYQELFNELLSA